MKPITDIPQKVDKAFDLPLGVAGVAMPIWLTHLGEWVGLYAALLGALLITLRVWKYIRDWQKPVTKDDE